MSGIDVVDALLRGDAPVFATVGDLIKAGPLPLNSTLPGLSLSTISGVDRRPLAPGERRRSIERIRVTVLAKSYTAQTDLIALVRRACADRTGDIADVTEVSVLTDGKGPDIKDEEAGVFMQSQDFRVSFNEAA